MKNKFLVIIVISFLFCSLVIGCNTQVQSNSNQSAFHSILGIKKIYSNEYMNQFYKVNVIGMEQWKRYSHIRKNSSYFHDSVETISNTKRLIDYPTFMDASGFTTTFKEKPKNVAVLFSSYAEIWQLAGGTIDITVEETVNRNLVSKEEVKLVGQGSGKEFNYELLLSYQPDLVILTADYEAQLKLADQLRMFKIPVLVLKVESFLDYLKALSIFTEILDTKDQYNLYGDNVLSQVENVLGKTDSIKDKPTVLFLRAYSYGAKAKTTDHFVGAMLKDLGAINIAESKDFPIDTLSQEVIAASDVDYIFISIMGEDEAAVCNYVERELLVQPAFSALNAVKEKKYYILPKDLFSYKPNQRWGNAYQYLANLLYPEMSNE